MITESIDQEWSNAAGMSRTETIVIVGLGNPGREYAATRHNLGFMVADELTRRAHADGSKRRFKAEIAEGRLAGARLVVVKPQTYMNLSGHAVREVAQWYRVAVDRILVIVDDLDQPFGQIRLRARGSAGGHNGLKSIFAQLGTTEVPRLRIGIGRTSSQAISHVLSRFSPEEHAALKRVIDEAADAAELWATKGVVEAMNLVNGRAREAAKAAATRAPAEEHGVTQEGANRGE